MQKKLQKLLVVVSFLLFPYSVSAVTLTGLNAEPNDPYLRFSWNTATTDTMNQADGYALQWSDKQSDIRNDKYAKLFVSANAMSVRLASFTRNQWYYFRIYTYELDGRKKILSNGSKILKWKMTSNYGTESEEITVSDVVIDETYSDDDSDSSISFDFGVIRASRFDTFTDLSWSRPTKMVNNDYDGFYITLATKSDLAEIVKTFKVTRTESTARIKGLTPDTQYYVRGAFYKNSNGKDKVFGIGDTTAVKAFKTIAAIDRSVNTRASRNIKKIEDKPYFTVEVGVEETETETETTTTSPTTTTTTTTSVAKRIAEIKAQIKKLETELAKLQGKKVVTTTKKTYPTTSTKKSFSERMKEALAARRASKK